MNKKVLIKGLLKECETATDAKLKTQFTCLEDKDNLYFDFQCEQTFPFPKHTEYNQPLYEGDIVEVLLSLGNKNRYLEIEINQYNTKYCVIIENIDGEGDIIISKVADCPFMVESTINDEIWACHITLPKKELLKMGWHENCYINSHRQDFDKDGHLNLYSLYPTFSRSFHKTKAFQKLYKIGEQK